MLVLVVDDSCAMRRVIRRILTPAGCEVVEAPDGSAALRMLAAMPQPPDVILSDWDMPHLNGVDLLTAVRAHPQWRDIALMMVTGECAQSQIAHAMAAGADAYLTKPFTPAAVLEKLRLLGLPDAPAGRGCAN
ncbi:response regulator [Couchioplanes azureus]|uniref:response regulator n=1 Tax=Couchioplanes caeruleus TaxID=56438 RepID=UPI00166FA989|nr:response regulator [Couchioplanes caeruleus]GGQ49457.1 response regulator [Couchioplanes caeruleus subsp. azureus]